jgi:phosphate transport system permease protein
MVTLPLAAFQFVRSPQETLIVRGFATAAVLMMLVLVLFITARLLGGRAAGHMSARQRRRATERSLADMERIETALGRTPS